MAGVKKRSASAPVSLLHTVYVRWVAEIIYVLLLDDTQCRHGMCTP